jgi:hypothetical protein
MPAASIQLDLGAVVSNVWVMTVEMILKAMLLKYSGYRLASGSY